MTGIVKLNVGGTIFQTSKSTLTKFDGFFRALLETGVPVTKDESGAIFIDRDSKHFRMILNFLRDGHVVLPNVPEDVEEIQKEAEYYLLDGLVELCVSKLKLDNNSEKGLTESGTMDIGTKLEPTEKVEKQNLLEITPLIFTGSCSEMETANMTIKNLSTNSVCFKLKTTQLRSYGVRPNPGLLKAGESKQIEVTLNRNRADKDKPHKFRIQLFIVPYGDIPDLNAIWKTVDPKHLTYNKFEAIFAYKEKSSEK